MNRMTIADKLRKHSVLDEQSGCILWIGGLDSLGYGKTAMNGFSIKAHRAAWCLKHGEIPKDRELDHKCRTRRCINTDHLELVTHRENVIRGEAPTAINARKTHCVKGHLLAGSNMRQRSDGGRRCRTCERDDGYRRRRRDGVRIWNDWLMERRDHFFGQKGL